MSVVIVVSCLLTMLVVNIVSIVNCIKHLLRNGVVCDIHTARSLAQFYLLIDGLVDICSRCVI